MKNLFKGYYKYFIIALILIVAIGVIAIVNNFAIKNSSDNLIQIAENSILSGEQLNADSEVEGENVSVKLNNSESGDSGKNDNDLKIQYHLGEEPTEENKLNTYEGTLTFEENTKLWARSENEDGEVSDWAVKVINNIDKINPSVDTDNMQIYLNQDMVTASIKVTLRDEASKEYVTQDLAKYGASGIVSYGLSETKDVEPTSKKSANQEKELEITIGDITKNGVYYLWVWDAAGNYIQQEIPVDVFVETRMVARIVSVTLQSDEYNHYKELEGTEYETLKEAIEKCPELHEGTAVIEIINNIANESNVIDRSVTINIAGYTVKTISSDNTTPIFKVNKDCTLGLIDTKETGKIENTISDSTDYNGEAVGVYIEDGGNFILGINDTTVSTSAPAIFGVGYGVYNEGVEEQEQWNGGKFSFFDGKITATEAKISEVDVALAIMGKVTQTPEFYEVLFANSITPVKKQEAALAMMANAEARIGTKTYTRLESAIEDAGTIYGKDGSQVEIVLLADLLKSNTIVIDGTKNIKLDLNGYVFTTSSTGNVISNQGQLEIVDTSKEQTGTIKSTTGSTIYNGGSTNYIGEKITFDLSKVEKFDEHGFIHDGEKITNNNIGSNIASYGYYKLDLSDYKGLYTLSVNVEDTTSSSVVMNMSHKAIKQEFYEANLLKETGSGNFSGIYTMNVIGGEVYYLNFGLGGGTEIAEYQGNFNIKEISIIETKGNTLTLTSGTIEIAKEGIKDRFNNTYYSAIINAGLLNVNGGKITSNLKYNMGVNSINGGVSNINGGDISLPLGYNAAVGSLTGYGIINVKGGNLTSEYGVLNEGRNSKITISGGNFDNCSNIVVNEEVMSLIKITGMEFGEYATSKGIKSTKLCDIIIENCKMSKNIVIEANADFIIDNSSVTTVSGNSIYLKNNSTSSSLRSETITIEDSTVNGVLEYKYYDNSNPFMVNITGNSKIISTKTCINLDSTAKPSTSGPIINIESGTLESTEGSIISAINSSAVIKLGKKDGKAVEQPILKSAANCSTIVSNTATLEYYDGKLIGPKDMVLEVSVSNIEDNYEIVSNINADNFEEITLGKQENVAEIVETGKKYSSLKAAVEACSSDGQQNTIKLLKDIYIERQIVVDNSKNIKINLNNNKIVGHTNSAIYNTGTLEIYDDSNGSEVNLYLANIDTLIENAIQEDGTEKVVGKLKLSDGVRAYFNGVPDYFNGEEKLIKNLGEMQIKNANIELVSGTAILNDGTGITNIEDTNINITKGIGISGIGESTTNIKGGAITGTAGQGIFIDSENASANISKSESGDVLTSESDIYVNSGELYIEEVNSNSVTCGVYGITTINKGTIKNITSIGNLTITDCNVNNIQVGGMAVIDNATVNVGLIVGDVKINDTTNSNTTVTVHNINIANNTSTASVITINKNAILNLYNGNIYSNLGTGISNSGTLNLGEKLTDEEIAQGGTPSLTSPYVEAKQYGIVNNATFNYYDGKIVAQTAINGEVSSRETGYQVNKEKDSEENEVVTLLKFDLFKISENGTDIEIGKYASCLELQNAIDSLDKTKSYKITVLADTYISASDIGGTFPEGLNATIDLNGCIVEYTDNSNFTITNNGNLTLIDSSEEKTGKIQSSSIVKFLENNGTVNFESGTIDFTLNGTLEGLFINNGTMNMSGAIIDAKSFGNTVKGAFIINKEDAQINITAGEIIAGQYRIDNESTGNINITNAVVKPYMINNKSSGNIVVGEGAEVQGYLYAIYNRGTGNIVLNEATVGSYKTSDTNNQAICNDGGNTEITNSIVNRVFASSGNVVINGENTEIEDINIKGTAVTTINNGTILNILVSEKDAVLNINGGNIDCTNGGQIKTEAAATINIGNNEDSSVSTTTPNIIGKEDEIVIHNLGNAIINYYDGKITSKGEMWINTGVNSIPDNYEINVTKDSDENYITTLVEQKDIVSVNNVGYKSLQEAVNACTEDTNTITVLRDFSLIEGSIEIKNTQNIKLNLNGKRIKAYQTEKLFINNGTFEITDDSIDETGEIWGFTKVLIENKNKLTVSGGKYYMYYYDNSYITTKIVDNTGDVVWKKGDIELYSYGNCHQTAIYNTQAGSLVWEEGRIYSGNIGSEAYVIYTDGTGSINWKNGEIYLKHTSTASQYAFYTKGTGNITIDNIEFNNESSQKSGQYFLYADRIETGERTVTVNNLVRKTVDENNICYGIVGSNIILNINGGDFTKFKSSINIFVAPYSTSKITNGNFGDCEFNGEYPYTGNVVIEGGTFNSISTFGTCVLKMYDGTVLNTQGENCVRVVGSEYGISTFYFYGGTIESQVGNGVNVFGGIFYMGDDSDNVNIKTPTIKGTTYGVNKTDGNFYYYDGTIYGESGAISGTDIIVPTNYKIVYFDGGKSAQLGPDFEVEYVASVGDMQFGTLAEAIDSASVLSKMSGETEIVTIFEGIILDNPISIDNSSNVTINLNGNYIQYAGTDSAIVNNGTLSILDNSLTGTETNVDNIKVENTNGVAITNNGTLYIGNENISTDFGAPNIIGTPNAIDNKGTLILYSGKIDGEYVERTNTAFIQIYQLARTTKLSVENTVNSLSMLPSTSIPKIAVDKELPIWTNDCVKATITAEAPKLKGSYNFVITKVDEENTEEKVTGAKFEVYESGIKVGVITDEDNDGVYESGPIIVESAGVKNITIKETVVPYGYKKIDDISGTITFTKNSEQTEFIITESSFGEISEKDVIFTIKEPRLDKYDLSVKKFISQIDGEEVENREPIVEINEEGKFEYIQSQEIEQAANEQKVTYTLRMYNESENRGKGKRIIEYIPEGLVFLPEDETNVKYGWKACILDENGNITVAENIEEANVVISDYLSGMEIKGVNKEAIEKALNNELEEGEILDYLNYIDTEVVFEVDEDKITSEDRIIENKIAIEPNENDDNSENDESTEKLYVKYFDLKVTKYIKEVKVKNNITETVQKVGEAQKGKLLKIDVAKSELENTTITVTYGLKVTNIGEIEGYATELVDYIPKDFKLVEDGIWTVKGSQAVTTKLENKLLKPGQSETVEITFEWKLTADNIGSRVNEGKITKYENPYDAIDRTGENNDKEELVVAVRTGEALYYVIPGIIILGVIAIVAYVLVEHKKKEEV